MINEKLNYYTVTKIDTIKELIELAVKEAGNKIAFEYKNKKDIVKVTYKEFSEDINSLGTALSTINLLDSHIAVIVENTTFSMPCSRFQTKLNRSPLTSSLPYVTSTP